MEIVLILLPLALGIAIGFVAVFLWSVKSGQCDDLETPAHRMLLDDETDLPELKYREGKKP